MTLSPKKTSGFTLLELLMVLIVLAIVASLAIPAWFDKSGRTLENATRLLAHDLREAQNRSIFDGRVVQVEFREDGDGYRVLDESGIAEPAPLGQGLFERKYSFDGIFRGVQIERVELGGDRKLLFDQNGYTDGPGVVVVEFRGDTLTLEIENRSGLMAISELGWIDPGN